MRERYDRYRWLLWGTALVLACYAALRWYDGDTGPSIIILLAVTCVLAVIVQLVMTQRWTARATGVLYLVMGAAVFSVGGLINYIEPQDPSWNMVLGDIVQAMWIAGPVLMLYGMALYLHASGRLWIVPVVVGMSMMAIAVIFGWSTLWWVGEALVAAGVVLSLVSWWRGRRTPDHPP